jgi:hypothetical protein
VLVLVLVLVLVVVLVPFSSGRAKVPPLPCSIYLSSTWQNASSLNEDEHEDDGSPD